MSQADVHLKYRFLERFEKESVYVNCHLILPVIKAIVSRKKIFLLSWWSKKYISQSYIKVLRHWRYQYLQAIGG